VCVYRHLELRNLGTTVSEAQTKGISHLLHQQFVPEYTVDDRERERERDCVSLLCHNTGAQFGYVRIIWNAQT
jgi:hypothetical protein